MRCTCASLPERVRPTERKERIAEGIEQSDVSKVEIDDRLQVDSVVGQGAIGTVYKVKDLTVGRTFAVKVLRAELVAQPGAVKRFERESKAMGALTHPNLVATYGHGRTKSGAPYFVMDYLRGKNLADCLDEEAYLDAPEALNIFIQIFEGIAHAHSKGLIHRDLKPGNLFLIYAKNGGHPLVKVLDFGIAQVAASSVGATKLTQTGDIFGSPLYMSPEQCKGEKVDARSDIYSLGCVMYEALTGSAPFSGDNPVKTILRHLNEEPRSINKQFPGLQIPAGLDQLILKCLEKDPEDRYQSAQEVKEQLLLIQEGKFKGVKKTKSRAAGRPVRWVTPLALLFVLLGALFFAYGTWRKSPSPQAVPPVAESFPKSDHSLLESQSVLPADVKGAVVPQKTLGAEQMVPSRDRIAFPSDRAFSLGASKLRKEPLPEPSPDPTMQQGGVEKRATSEDNNNRPDTTRGAEGNEDNQTNPGNMQDARAKAAKLLNKAIEVCAGHNFSAALPYYRQALLVASAPDCRPDFAWLYNFKLLYAECQSHTQQSTAAIKMLGDEIQEWQDSDAYAVHGGMPAKYTLAMLYDVRGDYSRTAGQLSAAEQDYKAAVDAIKQVPAPGNGLGSAYSKIIDIYRNDPQHQADCRRYVDEFIRVFNQVPKDDNLNAWRGEFGYIRAEILAQAGDYKGAADEYAFIKPIYCAHKSPSDVNNFEQRQAEVNKHLSR